MRQVIEVWPMALSSSQRWPISRGEAHSLLLKQDPIVEETLFLEVFPEKVQIFCRIFENGKVNIPSKKSPIFVKENAIVLVHTVEITHIKKSSKFPFQWNDFIWTKQCHELFTHNNRTLICGPFGTKRKSYIEKYTQQENKQAIWYMAEDGNCMTTRDLFEAVKHLENPCIIFDELDLISCNKPESPKEWKVTFHLLAQLQNLRWQQQQSSQNEQLTIIGLCETKNGVFPHLVNEFFTSIIEFDHPKGLLDWKAFWENQQYQDASTLANECIGLTLAEAIQLYSSQTTNITSRLPPRLLQQPKQQGDLPFTYLPPLSSSSSSSLLSSNDDGLESFQEKLQKKTLFADIIGHADAKRIFTQAFVWPRTRMEEMTLYGVDPIQSIILHGPPGSGKSELCRVALRDTECHAILVAANDIIRGDVGESEKRVKSLFQLANYQFPKPICMVIDEAHALFSKSVGNNGKKVLSQFLKEMNVLESQVILIAITNYLNDLDPSILQRFQRKCYLGPLTSTIERQAILEKTMNSYENISFALTASEMLQTFMFPAQFTGANFRNVIYRANVERIVRIGNDKDNTTTTTMMVDIQDLEKAIAAERIDREEVL